MTVTTIHQGLRDEHKLPVSISAFRRWVHATLPDEVKRSQVTVLCEDIEPGEEAQIDYGFLGQWINPRTGKRHRIWAFVMVLRTRSGTGGSSPRSSTCRPRPSPGPRTSQASGPVGRTLYSVPWKLIGRRVDVRSTATMVQVFLDGELAKTHAALEQGKRTDRSDCPPEKIAFQMKTPIWCRIQASEIGDACREVIDQLLEVNALYRLRAAQGVPDCGRSTARRAWRPPARGQSRSATRPTAPSRAS
ncbi:hypothetical protein [Streptomyces sp. NPDC048527]|uniref:Mu transposase domain-containing protein n=1 Tax=Streptomyces sp. NPDC048527 TaxID=3365568 RepID=UPI00371B36FB